MEIIIDNLKINYEKQGENNNLNVILLHGWGASIESFRPVINNLATNYTVYAIDFPGFGKSQRPPETYHVVDYSKLVLQFIKELNLENVVLVGHSFGGRVIIKLIGELGYKPKKVILVDSAGIKPKRKLKYYIKVYTFKIIKKVASLILGKEKAEKLANKYRGKVGSTDYKNADDVMKEVFKNVVEEDLTHYLSSIEAPTLLVWGEEDRETPLEDGKKMESLIKNAGLVTFKGAGHFSYLNNINQFLVIINNFLKGGK